MLTEGFHIVYFESMLFYEIFKRMDNIQHFLESQYLLKAEQKVSTVAYYHISYITGQAWVDL